jgi:hypothetical protein
MFTTAFARDLAERTIATFAEAFAVLLAASGVGVLEVDWLTALSLAAMTALVALLKGVAAGYKDPVTGASVLSEPPPRVERGEHGAVNLPFYGASRDRSRPGKARIRARREHRRDPGHVDLATVLLVGILVILVLVLFGFLG